jgi:hypothetical protein
MSRRNSAVVLGMLLCLACVSSVLAKERRVAKEKPSAQEKPATAKETPATAKGEPQLDAGQAAIEEALSQPTQLEFIETPLSDVIEFLKDKHHIEIQLDNKALGDVGVGSDTPVTRNLRAVSLRSALNLMLKDLNLAWIISDEVLLITTPEEAESKLTTKAYDVSDLVVCRDNHDQLWDDYDTLIDTICSCVMPMTWDQVGGPGSIAGATLGTSKVLVVSQTDVVHEKIAKLLADIREVAKKSTDKGPPQREKPKEPTRCDGAIGGATTIPARAATGADKAMAASAATAGRTYRPSPRALLP